MRHGYVWLSALALGVSACASSGATSSARPAPGAPASTADAQTAAAPPSPVQQGAGSLVPPGYGTLKQDQITVALRSGPQLLIKVTPLDESVIRLAAPDTYNRLHALAESRRGAAERQAGAGAQLFLVSFFSYQPDVPFQPEDLQLVQQGRNLRPAAILALTPDWGRQRLGQQETQQAVYAFDSALNLNQPLTVRYGMEQSDDWSAILPVLEIERGKVEARAKG
ncbi:MAG TPA: hypothetical protein VFQ38_18200 [Longimicrobiales bacterium]|nr:hypothetical protein [Longimicrobiales bacterium]